MNNSLMYFFEAGICLALFYLIYWTFLKKETFFVLNRFFLMLSIPISFILPLVKVPSPFLTRPLTEKAYILTQPAGMQISRSGTTDILWLIYLLGAGLFFLLLSYKLVQLFILIKRYGYKIHEGIKIVFIDKDTTPFSFFNFFFINKRNFSDQDFKRIIAHESVHAKQYHSIDMILLELLTIFQWFNPFVWPYKKSLKETHEYLADNAVIAQGCSKAKYQLLIFEQHVGVKLFEFANNFNQSQIKRRITMMEKIKSRGRAKFKILLIVPMVCLLLLAFAEPRSVKAPEQSSPNDGSSAMLSPESSPSPAVTLDKDKSQDQKKKELEKKLKEIKLKEKKLKEAFAETKDPEKRKAIAKKLQELKNMRAELTNDNDNNPKSIKEMELELKELLANTKDPEKRKKIEEKLKKLYKKIEQDKKEISHLLTELKEKWKNTTDPEKKKLIEKKILQLKKQLESKKK
ncbi:MAG: hypothetical protein JSV96_16330 [Candidatus Aminicenantes bacterium]|nr:MAG: hypothetical protein JSV96_16330 [Candidatus Aminicenantes bacterium]